MQNTSHTLNNQFSKLQQIKDAKYKIIQVDFTGDQQIFTGAISDNLQFIIAQGSDQLLKIWNYKTNHLIQSIKLKNQIRSCKFTADSQLLYVGVHNTLYQFYVKNKFKKASKYEIHTSHINNIYCISNTLILTASWDRTIIKIDFQIKQQLFRILAHNNLISGLDYNKSFDIIASASDDKSIKLWNGTNGSLILEKLNAHNNIIMIRQVLFIENNNQLISLGFNYFLILWNINYQTNQLEKLFSIKNSGFNISLVLQQQYIVTTSESFIKVYTIQGDFVRKFDHGVEDLMRYNTSQHDSMKAILILGANSLCICKIDLD